MSRWIGLGALLALTSCKGCGEKAGNGDDGLPEGLELDGPLFTVDTTTAVFSFPVNASATTEVQGVLSDDVGRRQIVLDVDGASVTIADADWNLPPAAGADPAGEVLVCWNKLPGKSSGITVDVPDPTQGVELWCRTVEGTEAGSAVQVQASGVAAWVKSVESTAAGSWVISFFQDDGWLVADTKPDQGTYQVTYTLADGMGSPAQVSAAWEDPSDGDADTDTDADTDSDVDVGVWYHDGDSDAFGDPDSPFESDSAPAGYVDNKTDCNDSDASINPAADEAWGDAVDNDCDGVVDEDDAVEGSYEGTVSMSIHLVGSSTCSWYGGTWLTCDGAATAEAYASTDGAIFSGAFSCTATGGGSCGDGTVYAGEMNLQSSGGTSFVGEVTINNGDCSSYSYDGTATATGALAGTTLTTTFDVYTCLIDVDEVSATVSLMRAP